MFTINFTTKFKKDFKVVTNRRYNLLLLEEVIDHLVDTGTVPPKYKPHKLTGTFSDTWECHIKSDWLLLWIVDGQNKEIWLVATGTHSDLF